MTDRLSGNEIGADLRPFPDELVQRSIHHNRRVGPFGPNRRSRGYGLGRGARREETDPDARPEAEER